MGSASRKDIERWLNKGKKQGATHMIVVCDTYDYEDYPRYVLPGENVREIYEKCGKVHEVYSFNRDLESQLAERLAFHFD